MNTFFLKKRCVKKIISVFVLNICFLPSVLTGILRREFFSIIYSAYQFSLENNGTRAGVHWAPVPGVWGIKIILTISDFL